MKDTIRKRIALLLCLALLSSGIVVALADSDVPGDGSDATVIYQETTSATEETISAIQETVGDSMLSDTPMLMSNSGIMLAAVCEVCGEDPCVCATVESFYIHLMNNFTNTQDMYDWTKTAELRILKKLSPSQIADVARKIYTHASWEGLNDLHKAYIDFLVDLHGSIDLQRFLTTPYGIGDYVYNLYEIWGGTFSMGEAFTLEKTVTIASGAEVTLVVGSDYYLLPYGSLTPEQGSKLTLRLSQDLELSTQLSVYENWDLTLDLNGHVLSVKQTGTSDDPNYVGYGGANRVIYCTGKLTIIDSNPTNPNAGTLKPVTRWVYSQYVNGSGTDYFKQTTEEGELWVPDANGSTVINGGVITGGINGFGGAIFLHGGTLDFQGGTIAGCMAPRAMGSNGAWADGAQGGGIYASNNGSAAPTVNMTGGALRYNWADHMGGAVAITGNGAVLNFDAGIVDDNNSQGSGGGFAVMGGSVLNIGTNSTGSTPVISGNKTFDVHYIGSGGGVMVEGGTLNMKVGKFIDNYARAGGGAIYCYRGGNVDAETSASVFQNNSAGSQGGAIMLQYGDVELRNVSILDNYAAGAGGAVWIRNGVFHMHGGEIVGNSAGNEGGAVYVSSQNNMSPHGDPGNLGCSATLENALIQNNSAGGNGGALYVSVMNSTANCEVNLTNDRILGNSAANGGAVYLQGGTLNVLNDGNASGSMEVSGNTATANGGAFYVADHNGISNGIYPYTVTKADWTEGTELSAADVQQITHNKPAIVNIGGTFNGNTAHSGGVLYVTGNDSNVTIEDGNFTANGSNSSATTVYGGVLAMENGNVTVKSGSFSGNNAVAGGVAYVNGVNSEVLVEGGTYDQNIGSEYGGVFCVDNGTIQVDDGIFTNNVSLRGGVIFVYGMDSEIKVKNGVFDQNIGAGYGGVICANGGSVEVTTGTFTNNHSDLGGAIRVIQGGSVVLHDGTYTDNTASSNGGVLDVEDGGNVTIHSGTFEDNYATYRGGVIYDVGGNVTIDNGTFNRNTTNLGMSSWGGVVYVDSGNVLIKDGTYSHNKAHDAGGVIYVTGTNTTVTIENGNYSYSEAILGGVVYNRSGVVNIYDGIYENQSTSGGGVICMGEVDQLHDCTMNIYGGTFRNNLVEYYGAAMHAYSGQVNIHTGTFTGNNANWGGVVSIFNGQVNINDCIMQNNQARADGGAVWISSGHFTMQQGTISDNQCVGNGGALYVVGGNITIYHGIINNNKALGEGANGGAVYLAGDDNTLLIMQSGQMNNNSATNNGGAICATAGTLKIGIENCHDSINGGASNNLHTTGRYHPQLMNNSAGTCGGGIAIGDPTTLTGGGIVYFYCGDCIENTALYKGVGLNVFMQGGHFYFYDGTNVGLTHDPDLVIIGGELNNLSEARNLLVLKYYADNTNDASSFTGMAELNEYMNLPDAEYFFSAPADKQGYKFFGWTAKGIASDTYVRNKEQYLPSGDPVKIVDNQAEGEAQKTWDGIADGTMTLYALWAPPVSGITYVNGYTREEVAPTNENGLAATYTFYEGTRTLAIPADFVPSGYAVAGWFVYQDEGKNANWGFEPDYLDGSAHTYANLDLSENSSMQYYALDSLNATLSLPAGGTNFGDITLVADVIPLFSDVQITKQLPTGVNYSYDENQAYVFRIQGQPADVGRAYVDLTVTAAGNGSVWIRQLPAGTYTVTEIEAWSWRYNNTGIAVTGDEEYTVDLETSSTVIDVTDPELLYQVVFTNTRENPYWLSGDCYNENWFNGGLLTAYQQRGQDNE